MGWSEILATRFTILTLVMLIVAIMDHHWIYIETSIQGYYSGIWKICSKLVCSSIVAIAPNVHSTRTLLILALFCGFISTSFMTITYHYYSSFTAYRYMVAAMGSFFTGSLVFLAMSVYTIRVSTHANTKTAKITYQWSFYMAWSSCPFFILSGLFGLMAHSRSPIHRHLLNDSISSTMSYQSGSSSYLDSSTVLSD